MAVSNHFIVVITCDYNSNHSLTYYTHLKPLQVESIQAGLDFALHKSKVLVTGSGKTLIFLIIPMYNVLYCQYQPQTNLTGRITVTTSPLNSIICQQKSILGEDFAIVRNQSVQLIRFTELINKDLSS